MKTSVKILCVFLFFGTAAQAAVERPAFKTTDLFANATTSLLQVGINGEVKEIWGGMDASRMRVTPLFLETIQSAQIEENGKWTDLGTLSYQADGTRPGRIQLQSDDGEVRIVMSSKKTAPLSPIFITYSFKSPHAFRWDVGFRKPDWITASTIDAAAGAVHLDTLWRKGGDASVGHPGPGLVLAAKPFGRLTTPEKGRYVFETGPAQTVVMCIDPTDAKLAAPAAGNYVDGWLARLGGTDDSPADLAADRLQVASDNEAFDRLFAASTGAVDAMQFGSGVILGDVFYYRDSWLRDGTYSIVSAAAAGRNAAVDAYFDFWMKNGGFSANGEREAQQPAICITGIWYCSRFRSDDRPFLQHLWPYVKKYGDYFTGRIDQEGMLNLTEEWICFINTKTPWPNAEVYSGLVAASKIADRLGHADDCARWTEAAAHLKDHFLQTAFDPKLNRFIPLAGPDVVYTDPIYPHRPSCNGPLRDGRVDSGMLMVANLEIYGKGQGIVAVDDPRFASTEAFIMKDLEGKNHSVSRFGKWPNPHSPNGQYDIWPIICGWAAQVEWLKGRSDRAWRYLLSEIGDVQNFDAVPASLYLPESWKTNGTVTDEKPIDAYNPMITWSHGNFAYSAIQLLLGLDLEPAGADLGLAPSLPPEMNHARVTNFRFRDWKMDFDLTRTGGQIVVKLDPQATGSGALTVLLPSGQKLALQSGQEQSFTVDPTQYQAEFGRDQNGFERARLYSTILLNKDVPADLQSKTAADQEQALRGIENQFFGE